MKHMTVNATPAFWKLKRKLIWEVFKLLKALPWRRTSQRFCVQPMNKSYIILFETIKLCRPAVCSRFCCSVILECIVITIKLLCFQVASQF